MSVSPFACWVLGVCSLLAGIPAAAFAQSSFVTNGSEYPVIGVFPGDQAHPEAALNAGGGWLVWEDNAVDGNGLGIGAAQLDRTLTGSPAPLRVNDAAAGDQEHAGVSLLNDGGAAFVWQGGRQGFQHIYARIHTATNAWLTGDLMVSASTNYFQAAPALTTLAGGNVVVAWSSFNQRGAHSMSDVYAQILSPGGRKIGGEFPVNQFSDYNQRSVAVAPLSGGGFVGVWISEQQRSSFSSIADYSAGASPAQVGAASVDVMARLYSANGVPMTDEFLVNTSSNICASPDVTGSPDGGFAVAWMEKDAAVRNNGWDVYARVFGVSNNIPAGGLEQRVNTQLYGDQFLPRIAAAGTNFIEVWTGLAEDGSREGIFGKLLNADGSPANDEFRVNTTTWGSQMHPAVASDGGGHLLAVWSSFSFGASGMDLYAQRYSVVGPVPLFAPAAPVVTAVNSTALRVIWAPVGGLGVADYELYADGATVPTVTVTNTSWTMSGIETNSTHTFRFDYVLADGRRSPLSAAASGTAYDVAASSPGGGVVTDPNAGNSGGDTIQKLPPAPVNPSTNSTPASFAAVAGVYSGLFYDPANVTSDSAGYLTAKTDSMGGYSGKLSFAGKTYSISGRLDAAGRDTNTVKNTALTVELQLDLFGGNQMTGRVTDGKFSAALTALLQGYGQAGTTSLAGSYTFVIPGNTSGADGPTGAGVGTLTVDSSGNIAWAGTLADGTRASGKTALSKNNVWPLYASLYRGGGLLIGWIQFAAVTNYDAYGQVMWMKQPSPGSALYPNGFTNETFLAASRYAPPTKALFDKGRLVLSGGNLDLPLEQGVTWSSANKVTVESGTKLKLSTKTGFLKGSVMDPSSGKSLPFSGVLFEKYGIGLGYFLGTGQSGQVYFGPNQ